MVKERIFWYRRILAMAVVTLSMALICLVITTKHKNEIIATGNDGTVVYPCGFPVGIYLETEGILVIGVDTITGEDGINYEPAYGIVREGDYIVGVNDINVSAKSQLSFLVQKYGNRDIVLTIRRGGECVDVKITPVKAGENDYKLGIWVKDDSQGIGTMTFIKSDGSFGALGHGISDTDTKKLLDSDDGLLYGAKIWGITKGRSGKAGSLCGSINYEDDNIIGSIEDNTGVGIYGKIRDKDTITELVKEYELEPMEICSRYNVELGEAYILSCVSGEIEEYMVEITELKVNSEGNKGIVLKVTDERLLNETGGIVQGMSGSPIIQNGRIVGAVTHVLVNDPTKGYGIFIEEMLEH